MGARSAGIEIARDYIGIHFHGMASSHIDALCHILYKEQTYNGYARADVNTETGCKKLGIQNLKNGVVTRGVLVDVPRLKNVPYLEPGTPIYVSDLEAWEKRAGVRVSAGDALFVRTGVWARRKAAGPWLRGRAEWSIIGDNLLHPQHAEFGDLSPKEEYRRSVFGQLTWRR